MQSKRYKGVRDWTVFAEKDGAIGSPIWATIKHGRRTVKRVSFLEEDWPKLLWDKTNAVARALGRDSVHALPPPWHRIADEIVKAVDEVTGRNRMK